MEKLTGGLRYCLQEGCEETVHPEDAPGYFPYCDRHIRRNTAYHQWWAEIKSGRAIGEEIEGFNLHK